LSVRDEAQGAWNAETETYQQDSRGCDAPNRYYSYLFGVTPREMAIWRFARTDN